MSLETLAPPVAPDQVEVPPRDEMREVPWSAWHLTIGLGVMFAWRGLTSHYIEPLRELPVIWRIGIGILFPIGWMLYWPRASAQGEGADSVRQPPELGAALREGALGIGLGIGIVAATFAASRLVAWFTGQSLGTVNETALGPTDETVTLILASFTLAPLAEEIFFRGFLYRILRMPCGLPGALLVQASIFALLHCHDGLRLLSIAAIGLALGAIYEWRRSLVAGIAAHATVNFVWAAAVALMMLMNAHAAFLGVVGDEKPEGLVVREVVAESPAAQAGVQPGDVLVSLDGAPITAREQLTRLIRGKPVGGRVELDVLRAGKPVRIDAVLNKRPREK